LRLRENCASRAQRIDVFPDLVARLIRVYARHAARRIRKRLRQALDRAKVHLEPQCDDERVVRDCTAGARADRVVRRVEGRDVLGNVRNVRWDELRKRPAERRLLL
jgi:hypothetical protein